MELNWRSTNNKKLAAESAVNVARFSTGSLSLLLLTYIFVLVMPLLASESAIAAPGITSVVMVAPLENGKKVSYGGEEIDINLSIDLGGASSAYLRYQLWEQLNGGAWVQINPSGNHRKISFYFENDLRLWFSQRSKPVAPGLYKYRVHIVDDSSGANPWSSGVESDLVEVKAPRKAPSFAPAYFQFYPPFYYSNLYLIEEPGRFVYKTEDYALKFSWGQVNNDVAVADLYYEFSYRLVNSSAWTIENVAAHNIDAYQWYPRRSNEAYGVRDLQTYEFSVRACNSIGCSPSRLFSKPVILDYPEIASSVLNAELSFDVFDAPNNKIYRQNYCFADPVTRRCSANLVRINASATGLNGAGSISLYHKGNEIKSANGSMPTLSFSIEKTDFEIGSYSYDLTGAGNAAGIRLRKRFHVFVPVSGSINSSSCVMSLQHESCLSIVNVAWSGVYPVCLYQTTNGQRTEIECFASNNGTKQLQVPITVDVSKLELEANEPAGKRVFASSNILASYDAITLVTTPERCDILRPATTCNATITWSAINGYVPCLYQDNVKTVCSNNGSINIPLHALSTTFTLKDEGGANAKVLVRKTVRAMRPPTGKLELAPGAANPCIPINGATCEVPIKVQHVGGHMGITLYKDDVAWGNLGTSAETTPFISTATLPVDAAGTKYSLKANYDGALYEFAKIFLYPSTYTNQGYSLTSPLTECTYNPLADSGCDLKVSWTIPASGACIFLVGSQTGFCPDSTMMNGTTTIKRAEGDYLYQLRKTSSPNSELIAQVYLKSRQSQAAKLYVYSHGCNTDQCLVNLNIFTSYSGNVCLYDNGVKIPSLCGLNGNNNFHNLKVAGGNHTFQLYLVPAEENQKILLDEKLVKLHEPSVPYKDLVVSQCHYSGPICSVNVSWYSYLLNTCIYSKKSSQAIYCESGEGAHSVTFDVTQNTGNEFELRNQTYDDPTVLATFVVGRTVSSGSSASSGTNSSASSSGGSSSSAANLFNFDAEAPDEFKSLSGASNLPGLGQGQFVAATQGNLNVSNGAANYSINIDLPPAVRNLKPRLALTYNSQSGNKLMGVGWGLAGLSAITRCSPSFATEKSEAQKSNPVYSKGDRLCLDGQKLVVATSAAPASNDAYWTTETEYKTELDNFSKIIAHGTSANGGHGYFKVTTKDGRVLTYGAEDGGQNSKIYAPGQSGGSISVWALDKVEDIYGNSYTVSYERNTANGEYYPAQINLGATGVVIFDYQDRIGQIPWGYNGGNKYQQTKVLSKVTTYLGASQSVPIKQYDIRYKVSPTTDRELVDKIYECGYGITGWQCANPVIFDWQIGELGFDTESSRLLNVGGEISAFEDINHDGYVDALGEKGILAWGEPSGGFTVVNYDEVKSFLLINTLAGRAAITTKERESGDQTYVDVFLSRFSKASTSLSFSLIASYKKTAGDVPVILVNDSNNDGLTDLIVQPVTTYSSEVWLQNSAGVFEKNPQSGEYIGKGREVSYVDYNGDRLKDLTYIGTFESGTTDPQNYLRGFENHGGFFTQSLVHKVSPTPPGVQLPGAPDYRYGQAPGYWHNWVDINADGNLDLLYQEYERDPDYSYIRYKPNYWTVRLSTGNSAAFTSMPLINTAIPVIRLEHAYSQYTFMYDYNKDGISEFILFSGSGAEGGSSSPSWFMRAFSPSYKQGVLSFVNLDLDPLQSKLNYLAGELTAPRAIAVNPLRGDVNNDGLMDLVVLTNINNYSYLVHHAKQQQPDLLSKITNGFGAITELSYSPLTNALNNGAPLYAPDAVAPVFPLGPVNRDMQVVKKISVSNGQGGFNNTYFNYVGGVQDLFRGFGGFKSITTTNTSTNVVSTTEYRQDWPYSGKIRKLIIRDNSGKLISVTENAYALHSENKRFPYLDFSIQKNYALTTTSENSPTAVSKVINTFDYCGNLKEQRSKTGTGITGYDITGEQSSQYVVNAYDYYGTVDCSDDFLLSVTQELAKSGGGDLKRIVTEFKPNARRDVWSRTDLKGESIQKTTIYDYQTNGVVKSVTDNAKDIDGTDELDRVTTYSNFLSELYPQTITNAENHATSITYDERFGAVKTESFLGQTTTNIYDSFGRLQSQTSPDKTVTENVAFYCNSFSPVVCPTEAHYAVAARVTNERQSHMLGEPLSIVFYDALQREVRSVIYSIGGKVINKVTQYNSNGYLHRVSEPYVTNGVLADSNGAMAWTTYSDYDALGRANNIVGPDGGAKTISYAVDGYGLKFSESIQVIKPTGASEIQTSNRWLNSLGQVTRTEDALYNTVTYTYDATGNLETTLVNNNIDTQINIHHDLAGNKIYIKDPDAGVIDFNFNGFGELRKQVWQKGIIGVEKYITYDYDKLGRQISRIDTPAIGNSIPYTWVWDTRQQGQLTSRSGNGFHEEYFYDGFFRLSRQIVTTNGLSNGEFVYTYDDFSRPETVKYPGGFKIQRDYHAAGYQVQTQDVTSAITPKVLWALGSSIDSRGAFNNQLWGNGVVTQTGFDVNSGRLASIKSGRLSTTNNLNSLKGDVQNLNYTFDTLGNLYSRTTARTDSNGITLENIAENYGYDKLNRVKTITSSGLFGRTQTFDYDTGGLGNLVSRSDVLTGSSINNDVGELKYERVRKAGIHAVTSAGGALYSYDDYGNMIIRGGESILYDTFNKPTRLVGASITDFYYGPDHELYKEVSGTKTTYKLAGGMYEVIVDGNTTTQKSYVDGVILNNRVITSGTESANDTVYLHSDHLGSVEATTNALGQFVNRMSFGAWGERQKSDWKPGNPTENFLTSNGFTGHDQLDSHNLIHMGGRVYDPNLGRFLSADLYVQSPYDSQSYNRYSYTFNNPLSYTDPSGYWTRSNQGSRDLAYAMQQTMEICCTYGYLNYTAAIEINHALFVEYYRGALDRTQSFFMGPDYSGNSFYQNTDLCQGGALGACRVATSQGRELFPDNPYAQVADMGQSLEDFAAEVVERTATRGFGNGTTAIKDGKKAQDALEIAKNKPKINTPYKRPSGATTKAQRESVQGKPCVDCGKTTTRQFADHKDALVKEYYRTGKIDLQKMKSVEAVQPHCSVCSARQGAEMSRYSRQQKEVLGL